MDDLTDQTAPDLAGRVALVTGGGRGIGRAIAQRLAAVGAAVVVAARTEGELEETVGLIRDAGGEASAVRLDVGETSAVARRVSELDEHYGPVDVLVNNAATVAPLGPTMHVSVADVERAFAVNVHGLFAVTTAVLPGMVARRWGRVANISSGIVARPQTMVGGNIYAATKSAVEAHSLNLAAELEHTGVTVNVYRPGTVDTEMQAWIRNQDPDQVQGGLVERFRAMRDAGTLVTAAESAASLVDRIGLPITGEIWSFESPKDASDTRAS